MNVNDTVLLTQMGICDDCGRFGYIDNSQYGACAKCLIEDAYEFYEFYEGADRVVVIVDGEQ